MHFLESINDLLDRLVLKTQSGALFSLLTPEQKAIAALEMLIGTATRSGVEVFFSEEHKFLHPHAIRGLELIEEYLSGETSQTIKNQLSNAVQNDAGIQELQHALAGKHFIMLYDAIRSYAFANFDSLTNDVRS